MVHENGDLRAIIRRDPVTGKHLVYLVNEATSDDIATLIKTDRVDGKEKV